MDPEFVDRVGSARKKLSLRSLYLILLVGLLLTVYGFFIGDLSNPLNLVFRVNNVISFVLLMLTVAAAHFRRVLAQHLDIPLTLICLHGIMYNSFTYSRLQALAAPAFDGVIIAANGSEELECVLLGVLTVSCVCNFQVVGIRAGLIIAVLAPFCWCLQVMTLGSPLSNAATVAIVYWLLSIVAFMGLRKHRAAQLLLQWEVHGLRSNKQREAMCGIMDYMCDCVLSLSSSFEILEECPRLSAILLRAGQHVKGKLFTDYVVTPTVQILKENIAEGPELGSFLMCLRDISNREIHVRAFYSRYQNEVDEDCYILGIMEIQETEYGRLNLQSSSTSQGHSQLAGSGSSTEAREPEDVTSTTLCQVESGLFVSDDSLKLAIDPDSMIVFDTSEDLNKLVGTSLQKQTPFEDRGKKSIRMFREKLTRISEKFADIENCLGELEFKLPDEDRHRGYDRILHAESCILRQVWFLDIGPPATSRLIMELCLHGKTEVRHSYTQANKISRLSKRPVSQVSL